MKSINFFLRMLYCAHQCAIALEIWVKTLLTHSLWVIDLGHTHSLVSIQWSGPFNQRTLFRTKSCLKCQKWSPYKVKGAFLCPFVQESKQMAHPALTSTFLQAAAMATMHCRPERCTYPPPPVPPFRLAQNLSSKWIVPTDNMWPKTDNGKRCHWLLKG